MADNPFSHEADAARMQALTEAVAVCEFVSEFVGNADKQTADLCAKSIRELMSAEECDE